MSSDFVKDLLQHKQWVAENMQLASSDLFRRAAIHDNSKFEPEEFDLYNTLFPELQRYPYGSSELKAVYKQLGPALQHHLQVNRHHPEYFEFEIEGTNGISQMTLIDLIEMVCDWLAASKRSKTGIHKGLEINKERYGISDQLFEVIKNTVAFLEQG